MYYLYVKTHNITNLKYLGKTSRKDPHKYKGSGVRWTNHIKKHGYDVTTEILLATEDRELLSKAGQYYSGLFDVVKSEKWANLMEETGTGGDTSHLQSYKDGIRNRDEVTKANNLKKTIHSEEWLETIGKEAYRKRVLSLKGRKVSAAQRQYTSKLYNSEEWKTGKGKLAVKKQMETKNAKEWKETVGKRAAEKRARTIQTNEWLNTRGMPGIQKMTKTKNSKEWRETVGKEASIKRLATMDENWKKEHYKTCEYCGKESLSPPMYKRWHGTRCKNKYST